MKLIHPHLILSAVILPLPLIITSCNKEPKSPGKESAQTESAQQPAKPYPLQTCIVSGDTLGGMSEPVTINYKGQTIKLCCKQCISKFNANPDRYLARLSPGCQDLPSNADHHHDIDDHTHGSGNEIQFIDNPFKQTPKN